MACRMPAEAVQVGLCGLALAPGEVEDLGIEGRSVGGGCEGAVGAKGGEQVPEDGGGIEPELVVMIDGPTERRGEPGEGGFEADEAVILPEEGCRLPAQGGVVIEGKGFLAVPGVGPDLPVPGEEGA